MITAAQGLVNIQLCIDKRSQVFSATSTSSRLLAQSNLSKDFNLKCFSNLKPCMYFRFKPINHLIESAYHLHTYKVLLNGYLLPQTNRKLYFCPFFLLNGQKNCTHLKNREKPMPVRNLFLQLKKNKNVCQSSLNNYLAHKRPLKKNKQTNKRKKTKLARLINRLCPKQRIKRDTDKPQYSLGQTW